MARASSSSGPLPPLANVPSSWAQPVGAGEERDEGRRGGLGLLAAVSVPCPDFSRQPWAPASASGPMPFALQRLRATLLRLHREREQLLRARDCARHLQAVVRLLRSGSSAGSLSLQQLHGDLQLCPSRGAALRLGFPGSRETLLLTRPVGLAAQHLEAAIEMQLRSLGRTPASLGLTSQLAELLLALPFYHTLQGHSGASRTSQRRVAVATASTSRPLWSLGCAGASGQIGRDRSADPGESRGVSRAAADLHPSDGHCPESTSFERRRWGQSGSSSYVSTAVWDSYATTTYGTSPSTASSTTSTTSTRPWPWLSYGSPTKSGAPTTSSSG